MAEAFRLEAHRVVLAILRRLDGGFLERHGIFFAGGTRIALELGEYRESRAIDFLCASRAGYRALRESVTESSLGAMSGRKALALARGVRSDQYGIRTWVDQDGVKVKLEVVREGRIGLGGMRLPTLPVPCLDHVHAFAEKLLANADRGLDASTLSRDAVDLAFMLEGWPADEALAGLRIAQDAYGEEVPAKAARVARKLRTDRRYRAQCIEGLGIADTATLAEGLAGLARLAEARGRRPKDRERAP